MRFVFLICVFGLFKIFNKRMISRKEKQPSEKLFKFRLRVRTLSVGPNLDTGVPAQFKLFIFQLIPFNHAVYRNLQMCFLLCGHRKLFDFDIVDLAKSPLKSNQTPNLSPHTLENVNTRSLSMETSGSAVFGDNRPFHQLC